MIAIAHNVIGWGGIGTFVTGLLNAWLSKWGFFKYKWVTFKLIIIIPLILFGMFFMEASILENINLLEQNGTFALQNQQFIENIEQVTLGAYFELSIFLFISIISSVKPFSNQLK